MAVSRGARDAISEGLSSWLKFEQLSGRGGLFSERYLAMPVAQLLSHNVGGTIEAEVDHPLLTSTGGMPPRLDFVLFNNDIPTLCVETKWADTKGIGVADVVWDCVRLELAAHHYQCDAMFILAGKRGTIDKMLASRSFNPPTKKDKASSLMHLHGKGRHSVQIMGATGAVSKTLSSTLTKYPRIKYATRYVCGVGSQVPKHDSVDSYTAAVWEIRPESAAKRHLFLP